MVQSRSLLIAFVACALCAGSGVLFAGGDADADAGAAEPAAAAASSQPGVPNPGVVVFYATLAEYEAQTGNRIESFNEAPVLAALVAAGELPPVDERLPDEPMVVEPRDTIGKYGGRVRQSATSPTTGGAESWTLRTQPLFRVVPSPSGDSVIPNVAKGWDLSDDFSILTVHLRSGLKWSDGAPFDADDFLFWYNDILLNEEISPTIPGIWAPGGVPVEVTKVDDGTVQLQFASSYPSIVTFLGFEGRSYHRIPFAPRHYLEQFHPAHNEDAGKVATEAGYDNWADHFQYIYPNEVQQRWDVNVPTVDPWTMSEVDSIGNKFFDRNPYYYRVDIAGNQLPYIDRQDRILFSNKEAINLAAISGELDYAQQDLVTESYQLYKENEERGQYRVSMWYDGRGSVLVDHKINMNHPDPVKRELFGDLRFRQALSLAINRDEVNEAVFQGLATPRAATVRSDVSFFDPAWETHFTAYDPDQASALLDQIGLPMSGEYRTLPDGSDLQLVIEYVEMEGPRGDVEQLVKDYFEDVGLQVQLKQIEQSLWGQRYRAGELDIGVWNLDGTNESGYHSNPFAIQPYARAWMAWLNSGGTAGEEPPEALKEWFALSGEVQKYPMGSEEYQDAARRANQILLDNLWHVGIIGNMPKPTIIKTALKNTPTEPGVRIYQGYRFWMIYNGDQWYWDE